MTRRAIRWGLAAGALYAAASALTFGPLGVGVRPLFEGNLPPQEYRWVNPPPTATTTAPAEPGTGAVLLLKGGSQESQIRTGDGQVAVTVPRGAFPAKRGADEIIVQITPLDPETVGAPPSGAVYHGNAYEVTASYRPGGEVVQPAGGTCGVGVISTCVTVNLASPHQVVDLQGTQTAFMYRLAGDGSWERLETTPGVNAAAADTPLLGTFVVAGAPPFGVSRTGDIVAIALGALAAIGGTAFYALRTRARKREEMRKKAAGRKYRPPPKKRRR
ncbi:MAG TPA: hypothetical protein VGB83_09350 [Actinomycetota bacterium]